MCLRHKCAAASAHLFEYWRCQSGCGVKNHPSTPQKERHETHPLPLLPTHITSHTTYKCRRHQAPRTQQPLPLFALEFPIGKAQSNPIYSTLIQVHLSTVSCFGIDTTRRTIQKQELRESTNFKVNLMLSFEVFKNATIFWPLKKERRSKPIFMFRVNLPFLSV